MSKPPRLAMVFTAFAMAVLFVAAPAAAAPIVFFANLAGLNEEPPNASPGTGTALVTVDAAAHTLGVDASFLGLTSGTSAAHIHVINGPGDTSTVDTNGPVATQAPSFVGFPLGVTAGAFVNTYDTTLASTYRAGFVTDSGGTAATAEAALFLAIMEGRAYFNIHTAMFPGGEIRGFLQPQQTVTPIPEPGTLLLVGSGIAGLVRIRRRRRM